MYFKCSFSSLGDPSLFRESGYRGYWTRPLLFFPGPHRSLGKGSQALIGLLLTYCTSCQAGGKCFCQIKLTASVLSHIMMCLIAARFLRLWVETLIQRTEIFFTTIRNVLDKESTSVQFKYTQKVNEGDCAFYVFFLFGYLSFCCWVKIEHMHLLR